MKHSTKNSKRIKASPEKIWRAFSDPGSLEQWMAPDTMTAKVHHFDFKVGGGYEMSLYYPEAGNEQTGKTAENEDRYTSSYSEIVTNKKIVELINFNSPDPDFSGEMIMEMVLEPKGKETEVTFLFRNIPKGIKPEDNESGTISTLEKLARFVE